MQARPRRGFKKGEIMDRKRTWQEKRARAAFADRAIGSINGVPYTACPTCHTRREVGTSCYLCAAREWEAESSLSNEERRDLIMMLRVELGYLPRITNN